MRIVTSDPGERDACRAERARAARAFVSEVLGSGHPCGDEVVLLVSEVFGNPAMGVIPRY